MSEQESPITWRAEASQPEGPEESGHGTSPAEPSGSLHDVTVPADPTWPPKTERGD